MMRIMGRPAQLDGQTFFLDKFLGRTARGYPVEANPKYMRDVIAVHGVVDSGLVATQNVKRTPTTESLVELEIDKRAVRQDSRGKAVVHVPGARRHHAQREGNGKKRSFVPLRAPR